MPKVSKPHYKAGGFRKHRSPPVLLSGTGYRTSGMRRHNARNSNAENILNIARTVPTLPILPMVLHIVDQECSRCTPGCSSSEHKPGVRKGHHSAQHCLSDRYIPRVTLSLSDRYILLPGTPEGSKRDAPINGETLNTRRYQGGSHPWESPKQSHTSRHRAAASHVGRMTSHRPR